MDNDPEHFANYNIHWYSRAAFLRLLIPEIIPERYRRVLYLDSDLVVSDDVSKLWRLPDEGKAFWAAYDEGVRGTNYVQQTLNFADVPADAPYFNSGVMLIDLPRWKAARVSERAQAILGEHSDRCINVDQDALNIVSVGNWSVLPPRWNFQVAGSQSWSAPPARGETIGITHFINEKPWNPDTRLPTPDNVRRGTAGERLVYDAAVLAASATQADHRAEILAPNVARSQLAAEGAPSHRPGCTACAFLGSGIVTAEAGQSSHPPVSPDQRCMGRGRRRTAQNFTSVVRSAQHKTVSACSGTELERAKESSHPHETSPSLSI